MQLVRKKAPRGGFYRILTEEERAAIRHVCGFRNVRSLIEKKLAEKVLLEMRQHELWFKCDCGSGDNVPMNSANLRSDTQTLYFNSFSSPHDNKCPLFRIHSSTDDLSGGGTRRTAGCKTIDYRKFLPKMERDARIRLPGGNSPPLADKTRRKRVPSIARLLFTLIEEAELNKLSPVWPPANIPSSQHLDALRGIAERTVYVGRDNMLSDFVRFEPWLNQARQEVLMRHLERSEQPWPKDKERVFYQIFMSDDVNRESVKYKGRYTEITFTPAKQVSINGESQEGKRGPYWVVLMFRRGMDGAVICSEGYAHAMFSWGCPLPVDSELERQTIRSIQTASEWIYKLKNFTPHEFSLKKPLFDLEVNLASGKGFVLPDFIVTASSPGTGEARNLIIETMGYSDDEYAERKAGQHAGMRCLGHLYTDPPKWPTEGEKAFEKYFFGVLKHL
ncbi:TPA: hypothetical protein ACV965_004164 [Yersinia enterocolitica]